MRDCDRQHRSNTFAQAQLLLLLVVLMAAVSGDAQTSTTGDIAGVVTDPSAAVVTGVPDATLYTLMSVGDRPVTPETSTFGAEGDAVSMESP